jgi:subfamily B ATP-binding cassette protein HlyB/CyaB
MVLNEKKESHENDGWLCLKKIAACMGTEQQGEIDEKRPLLNFSAIITAAENMSLKAIHKISEDDQLTSVSLPAIVLTKNGFFMVVLEQAEGKTAVYIPWKNETCIIKNVEFSTLYSGQSLSFKKKFSWKDIERDMNLQWFMPILFKYKRYFLEIIGAAFSFQLLGLVIPLCTQVILDKVIVDKGMVTLNVLAVCMVMVIFFQAVMDMIRRYLFTHTTNKIDAILGMRMMRHLLKLPMQYFERRQTGDILLKISALDHIREFLTKTTINAGIDIIFSLIFFMVMFYYSAPLTVVAVLAIPIQILINVLGTPLYQKRLQESWNVDAGSHAFLVEAITGMQTIKSLAVEPQFRHHWEILQAKNVSRNIDKVQLSVAMNEGTGAIQKLVSYLIIWFGGILVIDGSVTIGQFVAFQMLANQASSPLLRLAGIWQSFQQTKLALQRIGDIINAAPEDAAFIKKQILSPFKGKLEFKNITFRYDIEREPALKNISFSVATGTQIGIVGRSGSGKSTLTKLLQKLYHPENGQIYIDGVDSNQLDAKWLRRNVGTVLQESYLFNGTIKENIAFAKPEASLAEIESAAILAGANEFITQMREGYDTVIEENGSNLSGGQKQRIAIARVLLTDPRILIFDEATSALDYESEHIIMRNMQQIAQGRTVLMITHRLANVRNCDNIFVLDKGLLCEEGTHEELIKKQGTYYHLYGQQGANDVQ